MRTADFTLSLHFTPGPQSAVRSPQSAVFVLHWPVWEMLSLQLAIWRLHGTVGNWVKVCPLKQTQTQLDAASSQAPVETWNFQCYSWLTFIYLLNLQKAELTANLDMASHFVSRHLIAGDFDSFALKKFGKVATLEGINATIAEYQVMGDSSIEFFAFA